MTLKTIEEHNTEVFNSIEGKLNTGVACPNCGSELHYADALILMTSYPPQKKVVCFHCNYTTNIFVR